MLINEIKDYERYTCLNMTTGEYILDDSNDFSSLFLKADKVRKCYDVAKWLGRTWKERFFLSVYTNHLEFFPVDGDRND